MTESPLAISRTRSELEARQAIIACALEMNARGINHGKAGNVSCRWPRSGADGYLITPSALPFRQLEVQDVVWLSLGASEPAPSMHPAPSSEWRFHRDLYVARADIHALVHTHSSYATSLACQSSIQRAGIPAFHYMVASCGGSDIRCAAYRTYGTQALSEEVVLAMKDRLACLMATHGQLAAGASLAAALDRAEEVERLCQMYWQTLQLGPPVLLSTAEIDEVLRKFEGRFA